MRVLTVDDSRTILAMLHHKLSNAGFDVSTTIVDVASRASVHALVQAATKLGDVTEIIHAAGVSPSQASPA